MAGSRFWVVVMVIFSILFLPLYSAAAVKRNKKKLPAKPISVQFAPDETLIKFKPSLSSQDSQALALQFNAPAATREQAVTAFHSYYGTKPIGAEFIGWQRVKLPAGKTVQQAVQDFSGNPLVEKVEPNYIRHADALYNTYTAYSLPNDPYYHNMTTWWFNRTKSDVAYNTSYIFGPGPVIVGVVDSGVDLSHPDLVHRLTTGYNVITPTSQPDDDYGHGTHVAGLIGAQANNGNGICGTAYLPSVKIMPVKVLDYTGSGYSSDIATGVQWAVANGAKVLNLSYGGYGISLVEQDAYTNATSQGCVLVAAAGNDNIDMTADPMYPAAYTNVIAVAATDSEDYVTEYSNYGQNMIALAAPGGETTDPSDPYYDGGIFSTFPPNTYEAMCGTSMAAPQISGITAMLFLQNPNFTPSQIRQLLTSHCENPQSEDPIYIGAGRINAASLYVAYRTPTITPTATVTPTITITSTPWLATGVVVVYPNPARKEMNFAVTMEGEVHTTIDLYNMAGERVTRIADNEQTAQNQTLVTHWDCSGIAPGIYMAKIVIKNGESQTLYSLIRKIAVIH